MKSDTTKLQKKLCNVLCSSSNILLLLQMTHIKINAVLFKAVNHRLEIDYFSSPWHCLYKCSVGVSINFEGETSVFLRHSTEATPRVQRFSLWCF